MDAIMQVLAAVEAQFVEPNTLVKIQDRPCRVTRNTITKYTTGSQKGIDLHTIQGKDLFTGGFLMQHFHPSWTVDMFRQPTDEEIKSVVVRRTVMACTLRRGQFIVMDGVDCEIIDISLVGPPYHTVTRSPKFIFRVRNPAGMGQQQIFRSNHMVEIPTPAKAAAEESQPSAKSPGAPKPKATATVTHGLPIRNFDSSPRPIHVTENPCVSANTPTTSSISLTEATVQISMPIDLPPPFAHLVVPARFTQPDKGYDADIETFTETEEADNISDLNFDLEEDDFGFTMIEHTPAHTTSKPASELRNGDFIMIENRLCITTRITQTLGTEPATPSMLSISARGWFGDDCLQKMLLLPPDAKIITPIVTYAEMTLLDISEDGMLSLIDHDGAVEEGVEPLSEEWLTHIRGVWKDGATDLGVRVMEIPTKNMKKALRAWTEFDMQLLGGSVSDKLFLAGADGQEKAYKLRVEGELSAQVTSLLNRNNRASLVVRLYTRSSVGLEFEGRVLQIRS